MKEGVWGGLYTNPQQALEGLKKEKWLLRIHDILSRLLNE